jgi:hypothetical protein
MAQNELSQNEIFQLTGNYTPLPDRETEPVVRSLSPGAQYMILKRNIRRCGIRKTAEYWKDYGDPYIRVALKLAASGLDRETGHSLIGTAVFAEKEVKRRERMLLNNALLSLLFGPPVREG